MQLTGVGLVALSIFWPESLAQHVAAPPSLVVLPDQVTNWAEIIKGCRLPNGLVGLLVAVEVAAYTSTLSALLNWGGSFIINDIYRPMAPAVSPKREILVTVLEICEAEESSLRHRRMERL